MSAAPTPPPGKLTVTVLGSGTSAGVPVVACDCPVCTSTDPKNKRLRSSILLRGGGLSIVVDTGSDFRQQALLYRINRLDAVFLTHAHSDHISGIDEIRLYNWRQRHAIPVYASGITIEALQRRFDYIFHPVQTGGGIPDIALHEIDNEPFLLHGIPAVPLQVMHGQLPVLGFRMGNFAYITDASHVPDETVERMIGVRYLILNALRHKPHPTHLNIEQAVAIARRVGAERTWFTHITHDLDHRETNASLPEGIALAHDGLEFEIEPLSQ